MNDILNELKTNSLLGAEALKYMDKTKKFVYHGSADGKISELEPRQQKTLDRDSKIMMDDGKPAVCATDSFEIAIFRAMTVSFRGHKDYFSSFGKDSDGRLHFRASKTMVDGMKSREGHVYVLEKKYFKHERGTEWRSPKSVKPITIIKVTGKDLPKNIEIISRDQFFNGS